MLQLRTFGTVDLQDSGGRDLGPVMAQPKRLALLVYLAAARPFAVQRRDRLLALFWPDLDESRARDALSQALRFLRQALGADVFVRRGGEDVGINSEQLWCDAAAFQAALDAGRPDEALELYRGDFLQGFFIEEADGFEEWMERERAVHRESAARGARELAEQHAGSDALTLAMSWGKRALELAPDDERALRRLLRWHDRAGDRAGAFRVYEAFARRFEEEFGCEPSPETMALAEQLRAGRPLEDERGGPRTAAPALQQTPRDPVGALGDRYRIVRKLGAGGMATVYLAEDIKHEREVALKVLRPEIAEGLARERFLREIRIASRLQHPNIVPLFDSGVTEGRPFYVMAHIEGETLREKLAREGRLEVEQVRHFLREVAGALAYAHERGVIHRDIKPENILLIDRRAVLSDFGIARAAQVARTTDDGSGGTLTEPGTSLGTPAYMAPEQAAGNPE
ncbi:MAG TPA: protein kinase, partial [Gemmatimonadales bacterium]|nr:protein kinase [Gemmatimonadales bacterium]